MKRLYLLLLGVFVLFISLTSVSYAYTIDDVLSYSYQLKDKSSINGGGTQAYNFLYTRLNTYWNNVLSVYNTNASNCSYFIAQAQYVYSSYTDSQNAVWINCFTNSPILSYGSYISGTSTYEKVNFSTNSSYYKGTIRIRSNGTVDWLSSPFNSYVCADINRNSPKGFFLIADGDYTSYINYNINGLIVPPSYSFIPYTSENVHVLLSNNLSGDCIRLPFSPAENYKRIGNIQGWEDLDGFTLNWSPILYVSGDETIGDVASRYIYSKQNGGLSDGHMTFMEINNGSVYVNVDTLFNRQVYVLSIDAHIGDDYFPIYLDGHDYDATFYSYFYTTDTSVPSNNTGISQQYYESLPPSLQNFLENNSTNFNDTQQNNINYLLNDMFTDVFSGDQFGGNLALEMGYSGDILDSNYYSNLIYDFYRKIINTIATEDTTSSITFNIRSKTFVLNSSDFLVPSGPLKTFVTTFLIAGIVYLFYLQIHRIVLSIATLDLYTTIKSFDQKHSVFM